MFKTPSNKVLPRQGDPRKFAQHGVILEGYIAVSDLSRVTEATESSGGEVQVRLEFKISEEKKKVVVGTARADLSLFVSVVWSQ